MSAQGAGARPALTADETRLLEALADRIFPPTDTPGAVDLGAVAYIEHALAGPYAAHLPAYRRGLRQLQRLADAEYGRSFLELGDQERDRVVEKLETLPAAGGGAKVIGRRRRGGGGGFFANVRQHVLEGIFGDPQYGGNRDLTGWKLVGFGGQRVGYEDAYINKRLDLDPLAEVWQEAIASAP